MSAVCSNRRSKCSRLMVSLLLLPLFLVTVGFQACGNAETPKASDEGIGHVASADGVDIEYEVHGQGDQALVFVHCWCCDRSYWQNQVDAFSKNYKVVTLDLAGHGNSGADRKDWTIEAYGQDVAAVVNKLGLKDVILIGHSMGGPVALEAARQLGDRVAAVVGVDTFQSMGQKFTDEQASKMIASFGADFSGITKMFVKQLFPAGADTALVAEIADDMASEPPAIGMASMKSVLTYDQGATAKELGIPIRVINSRLQPTDVKGNRALAGSFEAKYMDGVGHFLHRERPEEFNQLLTETITEFWPKK